MGFSHAIVAVQDLSPQEVGARLGRTLGDRPTSLDVAVTQGSPGWCVSPPLDGWTFIVDQTQALLTDVKYALDEVSGPPPELWDRLGFDGSRMPTDRAHCPKPICSSSSRSSRSRP